MNNAKKHADRKVLLIVSIVAALILWFVVNVFINPDGDRVFSGVPVSLTSGQRTLDVLGLDIVGGDSLPTVSVEVSGSRLAISKLTAGDFTVTPRFTNVTAAGTYTLELVVTLNNSNDIDIVSFSPRTVDLTVARTDSVTLPVACLVKSDVPDGYYLSDLTAVAESVTVTGPADLISVISSAGVEISLTASGTFSDLPIRLYDAEGNEVSSDTLKLDLTGTDVTVSLLKSKELSVVPSLSGYPAAMPAGLVTLSVPEASQTVTVAGPDAVIDALSDSYSLSVDITSVTGNEIRVLPLTLPAGVVSIDGVEDISLSIELSDEIYFQDVTVSRFELSRALADSGADITVTTKSLKVRIAGTEDVIAAVTEKNLVATVLYDSDQPLQKGQYSMTTTVSFCEIPDEPSYSGQFWVICDNDVTVKVN